MSLARVLSKAGAASRTEARAIIESGRVAVNGRAVLNPDARIDMDRDQVLLDGRRLTRAEPFYLALNKPRGLVTSMRDEKGRPTVYSCFGAEFAGRHLFPVGRLDKASEGLLLFTNDTRWANRILGPHSGVPKIYQVQVKGVPTPAEMDILRREVRLEDGRHASAERVRVCRQGEVNSWLEVVLHGGLNRQIRRMAGAAGLEVMRLIRIAVGPVRLGDLPKGAFRKLTDREVLSFEAVDAPGP